MTTAQAIATSTTKPLTMKQIAGIVKFAGNDNIQKTITTLVTVPNAHLNNDEKMKELIGEFLFNALTERTSENGTCTVGRNVIQNIEIQDFEILETSPTLFQRTNMIVEFTFLMTQTKMIDRRFLKK